MAWKQEETPSKCPLGTGRVKKSSRYMAPAINPNLLGHGISYISTKFDKTFYIIGVKYDITESK